VSFPDFSGLPLFWRHPIAFELAPKAVDLRERGEDRSSRGLVGLRAGRDRQKATGARPGSLQNSADSQRYGFPKAPDFKMDFELQRRVTGRRVQHAIEPIRFLAGQHRFINKKPDAVTNTGT
jgi:hypothetical protein